MAAVVVAVITGPLITVMAAMEVLLQPDVTSLPVTVYTVLDVGWIVRGFPIMLPGSHV